VNDELFDFDQGSLYIFLEGMRNNSLDIFHLDLRADLWGLVVTFRCTVQSLDFPLTGRPIVPTLQQGAEQFAPTYRVRPYERGLYQLNNCLSKLQGENKEVISISDLKGVSININHTNRNEWRQTDRQILLDNLCGVVMRLYSSIPAAAFQQRAGYVYGADDKEPQRCV